MKIIIGARGSLLSVCQAEAVIKSLKKEFPQFRFILKKITTQPDRLKDWRRQGKGIFVKEIEEALLEGKIDIAVHSMKDLPSRIPKQLEIAAVTKREDPRDVLIVKDMGDSADAAAKGQDLFNLKIGSVIGTGSLRRASQLTHWRPDLRIENLRGNLDTRIRKLNEGKFDAIVVASAGVKRLGYKSCGFNKVGGKNIFLTIPTWMILPAAGQGALGIEIRKQDKIMRDITKRINDPETYLCVSCERALLKKIGAGCRFPLGALAEIKNGKISLEAALISLDGKRIIRLSQKAPLRKAEALARSLAKAMLRKGGREILKDAQKNW